MMNSKAKRNFSPLGHELSRFPLLFSKSIFFGQKPSPKRPTKISSGTISLIDIGNGPVGITCQHIVKEYRSFNKKNDNVVCNVGNVQIDLISQLIDENSEIDIAVIGFTKKQITAITSESLIGSNVFKPSQWPPEPPKKDEYVMFGGFPGFLRTIESFDEIVFSSWSHSGTRIDSVSPCRFISPFDRDCWEISFGVEDNLIYLEQLGGLSGCPAFINRGLRNDFVGVVTDYNENLDSMFFASAQSITTKGLINLPV